MREGLGFGLMRKWAIILNLEQVKVIDFLCLESIFEALNIY
jgi:hypothetical protein